MSSTDNPESAPGLLEAIFRFWWVVLLGAVVGMFLASVVNSRIDTQYEAETKFALGSPVSLDPIVRPNAPKEDVHAAKEADRVRSSAVRQATAQMLCECETPNEQDGQLTADEIGGRVSAGVDTSTGRVTVSATAPTGEEAASIANAVRDAYQLTSIQAVLGERESALQSIATQTASLETDIRDNNDRLLARSDAVSDQLRANRSFGTDADFATALGAALREDPETKQRDSLGRDLSTDLSELVNRKSELEGIGGFTGYVNDPQAAAEVPSDPSQPKPTLYRLLGLLAGLGLGAIAAWWLTEQLPKTDAVRSIDVATKTGLPMLVELTGLKGSDKIVVQSGKSPNAPAYEDLLFTTLHQVPTGERVTIAVAGPKDAPGSSVATNLALAAARKELDAVLVDADLNARTLTRAAQVSDRPGLINLGRSDSQLDQCVVNWSPGGGQAVDFVGTGTGAKGSGSQFFRSAELTKALEVLANNYDLIILNAPVFPGSGHVQAIASQSSFTVLTVDDEAEDADLELLRQRAALLDGRLAGVAVSHHERPWWRPAALDALTTKLKRFRR